MILTEERKEEIEKLITSFCEDCDLPQDGPIDVVLVARKKGFVVQRLNMGKDTTGMMLYDSENNIAGTNTNKLIVIKKGLPEEKSRLILAHELGHYAFQMGEKCKIASREYSRLKISPEEQDADYFARALLMPKNRIVSLIEKLKAQGLSDNEIICSIAEIFKVTESKAKLRFYDLIN
ncbi:ImmA/IrrE family metallo-endopeptidase [bacterium]|nr:ImmA/IrrE family metallo-endopeptidase [bacterium]